MQREKQPLSTNCCSLQADESCLLWARSIKSRFHPYLISNLFICQLILAQQLHTAVEKLDHRILVSILVLWANCAFASSCRARQVADSFGGVVHSSGETMSYFYIRGPLKVFFTKKCKQNQNENEKLKAPLEHESIACLGLSSKK